MEVVRMNSGVVGAFEKEQQKHVNKLKFIQKCFQTWADENSAQAEDESNLLSDCGRSYHSGVAHGLREASNYIASLL